MDNYKNMNCLYCYKKLSASEVDFHTGCSMKMFGVTKPPLLPFTENQMEELAVEVIQSQAAITGVQPKISLHVTSDGARSAVKKFTIVGLWGGYILKPPTPHYEYLPEVEDLTMHLAELASIKTVPHSLMRLESGNLAYITKRVDRIKKEKLPMEDMCQLTEKLTEDKYRGSYEQIAKTIAMYSDNPGIDIVNFMEQVVFSFITGNADMHLKNFSLIHLPKLGYTLCPAYDMVSTVLVNPEDKEELALTLNGKKKKINRNDFEAAFTTLKLEPKQLENIFKKMKEAKSSWLDCIDNSFVPQNFKDSLMVLIQNRTDKLS